MIPVPEDAILEQWEAGESVENRGRAAREAARYVLRRFAHECLAPLSAIETLSEAHIYRWLRFFSHIYAVSTHRVDV